MRHNTVGLTVRIDSICLTHPCCNRFSHQNAEACMVPDQEMWEDAMRISDKVQTVFWDK